MCRLVLFALIASNTFLFRVPDVRRPIGAQMFNPCQERKVKLGHLQTNLYDIRRHCQCLLNFLIHHIICAPVYGQFCRCTSTAVQV